MYFAPIIRASIIALSIRQGSVLISENPYLMYLPIISAKIITNTYLLYKTREERLSHASIFSNLFIFLLFKNFKHNMVEFIFQIFHSCSTSLIFYYKLYYQILQLLRKNKTKYAIILAYSIFTTGICNAILLVQYQGVTI